MQTASSRQESKRTREYNRERGATVYPIKAGTVFKLHRVAKLKYKRNPAFHESHVWLWIVKVWKITQTKQASDRTVTVIYFSQPISPTFKDLCNIRKRYVQFDSVRTALYGGYDVVTEKCVYARTMRSMKRFYKMIGVYQ